MTTAYLTDLRYDEHTMPGHIEHAGRLQATRRLFAETDITSRLLSLAPRLATEEELLRVHTSSYLQTLAWSARQDRALMIGSDTYMLPVSAEIARLSAGASLRAVEAVMSGEADNALVAARPPGHHARPDQAMGFCLLSNVALAARHAQAVYDIERVMIVDFDVHHGNGTQDVFFDDPSVFYLSTHQSPFYPGTGALRETGRDDGRGATINVPLAAGHDDDSFAAVFEHVVWKAVWRFKPQLILVSAGFDCHWGDLLGGMQMTLPGYAHLANELVRMAKSLCEGRIIFVLEGGYNLDAVAHGMLNVAYALLGDDTVSDPLGLPTQSKKRRRSKSPDIAPVLDQVCAIHDLG